MADARWWLSLGTRSGSAAMVWPLKQLGPATSPMFILDPLGTYSWCVVLDLNDWEAFMLEWRGPLHQRIASDRTPKHSLVAERQSAPVSLMKVVASQACWALSKTTVSQITKFEGIPVGSKTLPEMLEALYMKYWPKARPEDVQSMLAKRLVEHDAGVEWWQSDVVDEVMEKQDAHDVQEQASKKRRADGDIEAVRKRLSSLEPPSKKGKHSHGLVAEGSRQYPRKIEKPEQAVTEAMARAWVPAHCRLYCDELNQRWLLSSRWGHRSFSFGKWGFNQACRQLVEVAWAMNKEHGGQPMPFELPEW